MKYRWLKGYKYELLETVVVDTEIYRDDIETKYITLWPGGRLFVKGRYAWDGPSGPTFDTKNFMLPSLIHDALYQLMREGLLPRTYRKYADHLLHQMCLENGMSRFRAWYVCKAVRIFGKKNSMPRKKPRGQIVEI